MIQCSGLIERLMKSLCHIRQRLFIEYHRQKRDLCRQITNFKPVNNAFFVNLYHWALKTCIIILGAEKLTIAKLVIILLF